MEAREAAEQSMLWGDTLPQSIGQDKNVNGSGLANIELSGYTLAVWSLDLRSAADAR